MCMPAGCKRWVQPQPASAPPAPPAGGHADAADRSAVAEHGERSRHRARLACWPPSMACLHGCCRAQCSHAPCRTCPPAIPHRCSRCSPNAPPADNVGLRRLPGCECRAGRAVGHAAPAHGGRCAIGPGVSHACSVCQHLVPAGLGQQAQAWPANPCACCPRCPRCSPAPRAALQAWRQGTPRCRRGRA